MRPQEKETLRRVEQDSTRVEAVMSPVVAMQAMQNSKAQGRDGGGGARVGSGSKGGSSQHGGREPQRPQAPAQLVDDAGERRGGDG